MDTLPNEPQTPVPSEAHSQKKIVIIVVLALIFIASIFVGKMFLQKGGVDYPAIPGTPSGQENEEAQPGTTAGKPSLTLKVDSTKVQIGTPFTVIVSLDKVPVKATDIYLMYDASLFKASDVKQGSAFKEMIQKPSITETGDEGLLIYSASVGLENAKEVGMGDVFSFTMTPLKKGTGKISFEIDESRKTNASRGGINDLGKADPLTITVE